MRIASKQCKHNTDADKEINHFSVNMLLLIFEFLIYLIIISVMKKTITLLVLVSLLLFLVNSQIKTKTLKASCIDCSRTCSNGTKCFKLTGDGYTSGEVCALSNSCPFNGTVTYTTNRCKLDYLSNQCPSNGCYLTELPICNSANDCKNLGFLLYVCKLCPNPKSHPYCRRVQINNRGTWQAVSPFEPISSSIDQCSFSTRVSQSTCASDYYHKRPCPGGCCAIAQTGLSIRQTLCWDMDNIYSQFAYDIAKWIYEKHISQLGLMALIIGLMIL